MNRMRYAPCSPSPVTICLHRPWWRRLADRLWARGARRTRCPRPAQASTWNERDLRTLRHLDAATLRDIGAPEWLSQPRDERSLQAWALLSR